jgi:hypothetical protein
MPSKSLQLGPMFVEAEEFAKISIVNLFPRGIGAALNPAR